MSRRFRCLGSDLRRRARITRFAFLQGVSAALREKDALLPYPVFDVACLQPSPVRFSPHD